LFGGFPQHVGSNKSTPMPIRKLKKKISYKDTQKTVHSLDVLNSRALLALNNYLKYKIDDKTHASMERLFRDYKKYKKEVYTALVEAFRFITKEQFIPDPHDPPHVALLNGKPPSKKRIKITKRYINQIARKVWKK